MLRVRVECVSVLLGVLAVCVCVSREEVNIMGAHADIYTTGMHAHAHVRNVRAHAQVC